MAWSHKFEIECMIDCNLWRTKAIDMFEIKSHISCLICLFLMTLIESISWLIERTYIDSHYLNYYLTKFDDDKIEMKQNVRRNLMDILWPLSGLISLSRSCNLNWVPNFQYMMKGIRQESSSRKLHDILIFFKACRVVDLWSVFKYHRKFNVLLI